MKSLVEKLKELIEKDPWSYLTENTSNSTSVSYLYDKPVSEMTDKELDTWHEMCESNKN